MPTCIVSFTGRLETDCVSEYFKVDLCTSSASITRIVFCNPRTHPPLRENCQGTAYNVLQLDAIPGRQHNWGIDCKCVKVGLVQTAESAHREMEGPAAIKVVDLNGQNWELGPKSTLRLFLYLHLLSPFFFTLIMLMMMVKVRRVA